jgi:hypothetical protein
MARRVVHRHPELSESRPGTAGELVVSERREEDGSSGQARELDRRNRASAGRLLEAVARVHDLTGGGYVIPTHELHPLDVSDDRYAHRWDSCGWGGPQAASSEKPLGSAICSRSSTAT